MKNDEQIEGPFYLFFLTISLQENLKSRSEFVSKWPKSRSEFVNIFQKLAPNLLNFECKSGNILCI